jgi:hypothetical protein
MVKGNPVNVTQIFFCPSACAIERLTSSSVKPLVNREGPYCGPEGAVQLDPVLAPRYFFFPLTFVPIRNNFRTVPVGRLFI